MRSELSAPFLHPVSSESDQKYKEDKKYKQLEALNGMIASQRHLTVPSIFSAPNQLEDNANQPVSCCSLNAFKKKLNYTWVGFLRVLIPLCFVGRALSCTYRDNTTDDAQRIFFQLPFIDLSQKEWANTFITVMAAVFCVTDAILTNITLKKSITELRKIHNAIKQNMQLLKDPEKNKLTFSTKFQLISLACLLPGSMYGSFLKGKVGVNSVFARFSDHPSDALMIASQSLSIFAGTASAFCSFPFQLDQALMQMRIRHALNQCAEYREYKKENRCHVYGSFSISFAITVAMASITMMSAFYDHGAFEPEIKTVSTALFIALSNIVLNTWFTTTPNFHFKSIQAEYETLLHKMDQVEPRTLPEKLGILLFMTIGFLSSAGNSLAVFPAITHIFLLAANEKNVATASYGISISALSLAVILAIMMFPRDYKYYADNAIRTLFGSAKIKQANRNDAHLEEGEQSQNQNSESEDYLHPGLIQRA